MYKYSYAIKKQYNEISIIKIQSIYRKYILRRTLLKNNNKLFNIIVIKYLKLPNNINYYKLLTNSMTDDIYKYDKKILKLIIKYQKLIKYTLLHKKYDKNQISNNIKKYLLLYIINDTILQLNNFFIEANDLENITNIYIEIFNSKIDNKYDILKNILNKHVKKTEMILYKYNNLGYNLLEKNIKNINNETYLKIYDKYISKINNNIDINNIYTKLINFMTYKNTYEYLTVEKKIYLENLNSNIINKIDIIMKNI
jgi:hypothetical protein